MLSFEGSWPFWGDYGLAAARYFQVGNFIPKNIVDRVGSSLLLGI